MELPAVTQPLEPKAAELGPLCVSNLRTAFSPLYQPSDEDSWTLDTTGCRPKTLVGGKRMQALVPNILDTHETVVAKEPRKRREREHWMGNENEVGDINRFLKSFLNYTSTGLNLRTRDIMVDPCRFCCDRSDVERVQEKSFWALYGAMIIPACYWGKHRKDPS